MRSVGKMLFIEASSEEDAQKIMNNPALTQTSKSEPPRKKKPLIITYDVPRDKPVEHLTEDIYENNFASHISKEQFNSDFKIRFKTGRRGKPTVHVFAEMAPTLRAIALKQKRVYLPFRALRVLKCNKCQNLGHVAKIQLAHVLTVEK